MAQRLPTARPFRTRLPQTAERRETHRCEWTTARTPRVSEMAQIEAPNAAAAKNGMPSRFRAAFALEREKAWQAKRGDRRERQNGREQTYGQKQHRCQSRGLPLANQFRAPHRPGRQSASRIPTTPGESKRTTPSIDKAGATHREQSRLFPPAQFLAFQLNFALELVEQRFVPRAYSIHQTGNQHVAGRLRPGQKCRQKIARPLLFPLLPAEARSVDEGSLRLATLE